MTLSALLVVVFAAITIIYARYFHYKREFKTLLYYKKSRLSVVIMKRCKRLTEDFKPTFWASNCHVQTILRWVCQREDIEFSREYLQMEDKGVIALDWVVTNENSLNKMSPVMLLIPDLTGTAADMVSVCSQALARKFRPVVFNRRGHGGAPLSTYRLQSFGDAGDLEEAIQFIHHTHPRAEIFAIAFSSGSGLLMSYLGDTGGESQLNAAVCVSPCYDAEALFKANSIPQPYNWMWTFKMKAILRQHPCLGNVIDYNFALQSSNVREYDERVSVKLNEYNSLDEYWRYNDPMRNVTNISVPVLCVSALDDPICLKDTIPFSLFKTSSHLFLVATERGGHWGFLENGLPTSWANKLACDYLETVFNQGVPKQPEENHIHFLPELCTRNRSYTT